MTSILPEKYKVNDLMTKDTSYYLYFLHKKDI